MRVRLGGRESHLGYCFNVLPGETVAALHEQISRFCEPLRRRLGWTRMGVGLWLAHDPAAALAADDAALRAFGDALAASSLYAFTLNGFPYGGFHAPRVKEAVFQPGWDDPARLRYTLDLARILAALLPDDNERGTISTLPLGARDVDREQCRKRLVDLVHGLQQLGDDTGKRICVCFEPEPGAAFERAADMAAFLSDIDRDGHVGICFDTCHAAVVAEQPRDAWAAFADTGIGCGKIQLSSALVVEHPDHEADRELLASYDEARFLHQVRAGFGAEAMDIPEAVEQLDRSVPWRVHFHVPVHRERLDRFSTTSPSIVPALKAAVAAPGPLPHLEVETYTWNVLPEVERPRTDGELIDGLAAELRWAAEVIRRMKGELG